jgi:hypothetical protein
MKNFYAILFFCCLFSGCTDDDNQATFTTPTATSFASKPEAKQMFDNSYKGIYKGIIIGNISGSIYVDLYNDNKIWARFQTENLETYVLENVPLLEDDGEDKSTYLIKFRFANENMSFELKLDEYGNNISTSNFNFYSNTISRVFILKEKSNSLIKCYTGTYNSHEETGNINFTTNGQLYVKGLAKKSNTTNFTNISGEIIMTPLINNEFKTDANTNPIMLYQLKANLHVGQISGYLDGDQFTGNWILEEHELGNWSAKRIL